MKIRFSCYATVAALLFAAFFFCGCDLGRNKSIKGMRFANESSSPVTVRYGREPRALADTLVLNPGASEDVKKWDGEMHYDYQPRNSVMQHAIAHNHVIFTDPMAINNCPLCTDCP